MKKNKVSQTLFAARLRGFKTTGFSRFSATPWLICSRLFQLSEINHSVFNVSALFLLCSSRRSAAAVRPADEAGAAGRHRHAGRLPVERRREFQIAFKILLTLGQRRLDRKEDGGTFVCVKLMETSRKVFCFFNISEW